MSKAVRDHSSSGIPILGALTHDDIITRVYDGFSPRNRGRMSRDDVAKIVGEIDFSERTIPSRSPQLHIQRLKFMGEKHIDGKAIPVDYDQEFAPGVNFIFIPKNDAGKSSILKTIKFALTGDNTDYDIDVRGWIRDIWLVFTLNGNPHTTLLSTSNGSPRALLIPGIDTRPLAQVAESANYIIFDTSGFDEIKSSLQQFFFQRLGLKGLSWTQQVPGEAGAAKRTATWQTYFQGLMIPDSSDQYLICDPQHSYGGQDGLIVSTFLGLNLAESLNRITVESGLTKKQRESSIQRSEDERQQIEQGITQLEQKLQEHRETLARLNAAIQARRAAVESGEPAQRLIDVQNAIVQKQSMRQRLEQERNDLTEEIQRKRATARRYREMARLRLHFTGLSVKTCPNCDAGVDSDAITREQQTHQCRLCGKPAHDANPDEVAGLEAEAAAIDAAAQHDDRGRGAINQQLAILSGELETLDQQLEPLRQVSQQGLSYALPTSEEEAERTRLLTEIGRFGAELSLAQRQLDAQQPDIEKLEIRQRVLEKIKDIAREEADRINATLLERLGALTKELAQQIGAESITDLNCSAVGRVTLLKHGKKVSFKHINNEGERLRVKLAFFLALMRIAREPHAGHHPGLLLIDQPGSAEMVPGDFRALATVFRQIDTDLGADLQIICCTARSEVQEATHRSKIYGPQAPPYAF